MLLEIHISLVINREAICYVMDRLSRGSIIWFIYFYIYI